MTDYAKTQCCKLSTHKKCDELTDILVKLKHRYKGLPGC